MEEARKEGERKEAMEEGRKEGRKLTFARKSKISDASARRRGCRCSKRKFSKTYISTVSRSAVRNITTVRTSAGRNSSTVRASSVRSINTIRASLTRNMSVQYEGAQ
jgi:hypothetical protein